MGTVRVPPDFGVRLSVEDRGRTRTGRNPRSSLRTDKAVHMAKGGRRPIGFDAGGICGHRCKD